MVTKKRRHPSFLGLHFLQYPSRVSESVTRQIEVSVSGYG